LQTATPIFKIKQVLKMTGGSKSLKKDKNLNTKKDGKMALLKKKVVELTTTKPNAAAEKVMGDIEKLGNIIMTNPAHTVWKEWMDRCTSEQLGECLEQFRKGRNDEQSRVECITDTLFSSHVGPLDELRGRLDSSKEGFVSVIW